MASQIKKSILVTKRLASELFARLADKYDIDMWHDEINDMDQKQFLERLQGKSGLFMAFNSGFLINDQLLNSAGNQLKVVSTVSAGYDHIDVDACRRRGILVGHTPNVLNDAMAEFTIGLLLATIRRFFEANRSLREGVWGRHHSWMNGMMIKNSVVGFIGAGNIGLSIMKRIKSFEPAQIVYTCRNQTEQANKMAKYLSLSDLLQQSDIVIVICSLNDSTRHLLSREQFQLMKSTSVLINVSRGLVVDQKALYQALQSKQIGAAGLDVMETEPMPLEDPLLQLDNVVLLPHIGSSDKTTRMNMIQLAIENLEAGLDGRPMPASVF